MGSKPVSIGFQNEMTIRGSAAWGKKGERLDDPSPFQQKSLKKLFWNGDWKDGKVGSFEEGVDDRNLQNGKKRALSIKVFSFRESVQTKEKLFTWGRGEFKCVEKVPTFLFFLAGTRGVLLLKKEG